MADYTLDAEVFEKAYIINLYHNKKLQDGYLMATLPNMFLNKVRRVIIFVMQVLYEKKIIISSQNIILYLKDDDERLKMFLKKHRTELPSFEQVEEVLYDISVGQATDLFPHIRDGMLESAFARFVTEATDSIAHYNSYGYKKYHNAILSKCRGIIKVHDILYTSADDSRDQLEETKQMVNSSDEYITTSSQVLNSYIGGFSRGYVATLIAKSSHGKSSWVDFNSVHTLLAKKVDRIDIITPEENAATRWRRVIAMINKIPTSLMRQKQVKLTDGNISKVRDLLEGRLVYHDRAHKYKDIIELMYSLKDSDMVIIDHLQSIDYPGTGGYLANMVNNIPGIISIQKQLAKEFHIPIINLSQVGDKEIQRSDRLNKAPRYWDAYGSSVMYQASREFLSLYYPFKDYEDSHIAYNANPPTMNDIQMSIEKSSYSSVGKCAWRFDPDLNTFADKESAKKAMENMTYTAPKEDEDLSQMGMFTEED